MAKTIESSPDADPDACRAIIGLSTVRSVRNCSPKVVEGLAKADAAGAVMKAQIGQTRRHPVQMLWSSVGDPVATSPRHSRRPTAKSAGRRRKAHLGGICCQLGLHPDQSAASLSGTFAGMKKGAALGHRRWSAFLTISGHFANGHKVAENQKKGRSAVQKNQIEHIDKTATLRREVGQAKAICRRERTGRAAHHHRGGGRPKTIPGLVPDGKDILTY